MVFGHTIQKEFLEQSFRNSSISHAYLFSGPESLGKATLALEFINLINGFEKERPVEDNHDLLWIEPEESIIKDQIKEMQKVLGLQPFSAPFKAVVINGAERMTSVAQNRLLKTLEEPKGKTVIFLISSYPEGLLKTIKSRTQLVQFFPLSGEEMRTFIKERKGGEDIDLDKLVFAAQGRPGVAVKLMEEKDSFENWWHMFEEVEKIIQLSLPERFSYLERFSKKENKNKESLQFLNIFLNYFRLLFIFKTGAMAGYRGKLRQGLEKNNIYSLKELSNILSLGERIKYLISKTNVNQRLALENLLLNI